MILFVKSIYHIVYIYMTNIRTFDLNLLRVLDALLGQRHVSAAARNLHLSQPATSAALSRLRRALGDPILVRSGHRMLLTPFAKSLQPNVRRVLDDIERTLQGQEAFDPTTSERSFRVAANDHAVAVVLSPLARRLQRLAPRTTLEIVPFEDRFEERLASEDYDLAIRDRWSMRSWGRLETLFKEDYVGIARRGHPRLSPKPTLDEFLAEGHVLISPQGRRPGVMDYALQGTKRSRRVAVTLPHFLAAPAVVANTDFVMTIARRVAEQFARSFKVRVFAPPLRLPAFEVAMAWHPRSDGDAGVNWLRAQVREVVG